MHSCPSVLGKLADHKRVLVAHSHQQIHAGHQRTEVELYAVAVKVVEYALLPYFAIHVYNLDVGIGIYKFRKRQIDGHKTGRAYGIRVKIHVHTRTYAAAPVYDAVYIISITLIAVGNAVAAAYRVVIGVVALKHGIDAARIYALYELRL